MKTSKVIFILLLLICISCQTKKEDRPVDHKISKFLIQIFPSFLSPSIILVDMDKDEVIFQRIGSKTPIYSEDGVLIPHAPNAMIYKMNDQDHKFIDNCKFENVDFVDHSPEVEDGYSTNMLFTYDDGNCKDVELVVFHTPNQKKLIRYLTTLMYDNQTDSVSKNYLKRLSERFK